MDYIGTKWKGQQIPKSQESDLMILSGGQTIVIFLIMVSAFGLAFLIFIFELINVELKNLKKRWNSHNERLQNHQSYPPPRKIIIHSKGVKLANIDE